MYPYPVIGIPCEAQATQPSVPVTRHKRIEFIEFIYRTLSFWRNGVMVSASDCHPKDRSSIPGQDTLVSTAVSQGESI